MASRYEGKPFLRLLECYVLWSLGELTSKDKDTLEQMMPKLQEIYKQSGSWQEIVVAVMELPDNLPELIRGLWTKNTSIATVHGMYLDAELFAQMFVDENLIH